MDGQTPDGNPAVLAGALSPTTETGLKGGRPERRKGRQPERKEVSVKA